MIKCGLCGAEFKDDQYDDYASHVRMCAYNSKLKAERNKKRLEEINNELSAIKRLEVEYKCKKDEYDKKLHEFKNKYPNEYEMNFKKEQSKLDSPKETQVGVISCNDYLDEKEIVSDILKIVFYWCLKSHIEQT